ncbi:M48 family peptidase [Hymenobacter gummosus]|uniref:M48 family peptidase n=1 Tax=Hymenobacter gummosus TaxID=1776032 RepID=A0A3S0H7I9_9BACT|nr:SprT family zinc-dependent metalloprotease [Hymenobacter gummosus]RTQ52319.1 M48 family peptidase [Hymenobacter gummosus]
MTTQLQIGELEVDVVRKNIRNVHLAVLPPSGRVRVATPRHVDDEQVRLLVIGRLGWIRAQQAKFEQQPRQTQREYVSGETHYYRGQRYRLVVRYADAAPQVHIRNTQYLDLQVRPGSTVEQRATVLQEWYRERLKEQLPAVVAKWEAVIGQHAAAWAVKRMKTKWGTCNIEARRIWLNLELAKVAPHLMEYVVVHELTHLLERQHNERFRALLDGFMPQWRSYREELNGTMLAPFVEG